MCGGIYSAVMYDHQFAGFATGASFALVYIHLDHASYVRVQLSIVDGLLEVDKGVWLIEPAAAMGDYNKFADLLRRCLILFCQICNGRIDKPRSYRVG